MGVQCEVPVNPSSWLYESQSAIYYYSPERALQLAMECGWADLAGDGKLSKIDGVMLRDGLVRFAGQSIPCVDKGFEKNEPVDVVIRPEDIDVVEKGKSPLSGTVDSVTFKGVHYEAIVDVDGFKWMIQTTDLIREGEEIGILLNPDDIHVMKKSEYSGMFGDYSSFSDEMDTISQPDYDPEGESLPAEDEE